MYMANASPNTTKIPPARVGLALGPWGFAVGLQGVELGQGGFFDTNMLVSPMRNGHVGGLNRHEI